MADNKSSEGKVNTLECMVCGYREVFTERQFKFTDGLRCNRCDSPVQPVITRPGEQINNRRMKKEGIDWASGKDKTVWNTFVNVDVSDALKGLKAVQREARQAAAALKELEEMQDRTKLLSVNDVRKSLGFAPLNESGEPND